MLQLLKQPLAFFFVNLFDGSVGDAFFELDLDGLVAVLRMVHPDARRDPLDVRTLLLVADLVDGVQQPGVPRRRGLLFAHLGPEEKKNNCSHKTSKEATVGPLGIHQQLTDCATYPR